MPRPSGLWLKQLVDKTGAPNGWQIRGTIGGVDVRQRAQGGLDYKLAQQELVAIQHQILNTAWHGERRGVKKFSEAATEYLTAKPRSASTKAYITQLLLALGPKASLGEINQARVTRLRKQMMRERQVTMRTRTGSTYQRTIPAATEATYLRQVIAPLRAILWYAEKQGWCDAPRLLTPDTPAGCTNYLLPDEAERLIAAAAPHLQPLLIFLLGTGARLSEGLYLGWREVDLVGARAIFWAYQTKGKKRRDAGLPPRVVAVLANLPQPHQGPVFLTNRGRPYADRGRDAGGGQIKKGFASAVRRAGLDPGLRVHDLRHSWASWHYALNHDVLQLKGDGGW